MLPTLSVWTVWGFGGPFFSDISVNWNLPLQPHTALSSAGVEFFQAMQFLCCLKNQNYLIYTSQLSSIFTVRSLDLLISFIFLQADIPLPQSHLECEFYKVRSWISAMSPVFRRYCPLYSGSAVSSSFQCQTIFCRIFFPLFFKQQELIFLPGFVFSCFLQVPVRGCSLPFTVPIHKIP